MTDDRDAAPIANRTATACQTDEGMAEMMDAVFGLGGWQRDLACDRWVALDISYAGPGRRIFSFERGGNWTTELQPPPPEPVLYDQYGRSYAPVEDVPGHKNALVTALDCLILRNGYHARARWALTVGQAQHWAACQQRAAGFLMLAAELDPDVLDRIGPAEGEGSA